MKLHDGDAPRADAGFHCGNHAAVGGPVIFRQFPFGGLLGFMWFGLVFFAGITSSMAMATPILAFFREEFRFRREHVASSAARMVFNCHDRSA